MANENKQHETSTSTTKNAFNLFSGIVKFIKKVMSRSEAADKK